MSETKEIMRTRKQRWGRYALPVGLAERKYPKDSIYLTTNKNMTDHRNLNCGYQIIFKRFKYSGARGLKGNSNVKPTAVPHRCSMVLVKQVTRRFH
jgi:hypothetical protein